MADYREAPAKCPACQEPMELHGLSESMVDTCPRCRGLWVDWFDGDLLSIVHETAPLSFRPAMNVDPAMARCPRCSGALSAESFSGSVLLLRCPQCAGCFVPREAFTALLELEQPAQSRQGADAQKLGAFARLLAAIGRFVGMDHTAPPVADYGTHLDLARTFGEKGMVEDALAEVDIALEMQPDDEEAARLRDKLRGRG